MPSVRSARSKNAPAPVTAHETATSEAGRVRICGSDIPAVQSVIAAASDYVGAAIVAEATDQTTAIVDSSTLMTQIKDGMIRPLDDLVAEHGKDIAQHQLITVDGKIMAIAFMADCQALLARRDVLNQIGAEIPNSYEDLLNVAARIKDAGLMKHPIGGAFGEGQPLTQTFTDIFAGSGGALFDAGTAKPTINSEAGIETLNMMLSLTEFMDPEYLSHDINASCARWAAGEHALMNMWGSRTSGLMAPKDSENVVASNTKSVGPLTLGGGDLPATTLWWTGWSIIKDVSDADALQSFVAMKHASSHSLLSETTMDQAVWLMDGFEVKPAHKGVLGCVAAGAAPYPMQAFHSLLAKELGETLPKVLLRETDPKRALEDIEAAYVEAAASQGFLN